MNEVIDYEKGNEAIGMDVIVRAEIDMQISTAHAYPRSITKVAQSVMSLVTISKETAQSCVYALPRGGKSILGPSIRLAEMLFSQWGNCRGGSRVTEVNKKDGYVEAEGVFHDLETNAMTTKRVRGSIFDRNGKVYNADMINTTSNAMCAKAFRNAILSGIPRMVWGESYDLALITMRGEGKTLAERHDDVMKGFAAFGLTAEQVYQLAGVDGKRDLDIDKMIGLGAMFTALKNDETTVEELLSNIEDNAPKHAGGITGGTKTPVEEEKPKRTRRTKDQMAAARLEEEEAKRVAQERQADEEEDLRKSEPEPEHDPETGEIVDEDPLGLGNIEEEAPTPNFDGPYNQILGDLLDGASVDDVNGVWQEIIDKMGAEAPEKHAALMAEFAAAEEE